MYRKGTVPGLVDGIVSYVLYSLRKVCSRSAPVDRLQLPLCPARAGMSPRSDRRACFPAFLLH